MSKAAKELRDQAIAKYRQDHTEQQVKSYLRGWDMVDSNSPRSK